MYYYSIKLIFKTLFDDHKYPKTPYITDPSCPMEYTTEYGYQWGKLDSTNATNIGKCARRCNITQDCCMFSYSQKNKICQLHSICVPSVPNQIQDYVLCRKINSKYLYV